MPFYPHGIKRLGSPGSELENEFYEWLNRNRQLFDKFIWESYDKKSVFDFWVSDYDFWVYIDVVGYRYQHRKRRLYTRHKDWEFMLDWAKQEAVRCGFKGKVKCYLAFEGYNYKDEFSFLRITPDLPQCDVIISSRRAKAIRSTDGVFNSVALNAKIWRDKVKQRPKLNKKQLAKVDNWIYGDVRT